MSCEECKKYRCEFCTRYEKFRRSAEFLGCPLAVRGGGKEMCFSCQEERSCERGSSKAGS